MQEKNSVFYQMSTSERKDVIDSMKDNFTIQEDPMVGIFWYDNFEDELFGITSAIASELQFNTNGKKTVGMLHKTWWKRQQEREKAKGKISKRFSNDYTLMPRGRIFQIENDKSFELMCGSWINDHIITLVKDEFNLQNVSFKVIIDVHWEIGHGWSDEYE